MTFLAFRETHNTGKTKVWEVTNTNDGSLLGEVKWHAPWRKYVLKLVHWNVPAIWSADCLADVAGFIEKQMAERADR